MISEKLIATARPIVEHWFTDVEIHDVAAVKAMQIGEYRLWSLRKTGTWMCNLNSEIDENKYHEPLASVIVRNPALRDNSRAVYLVHKTAENDCEIVLTSYEELEYLV